MCLFSVYRMCRTSGCGCWRKNKHRKNGQIPCSSDQLMTQLNFLRGSWKDPSTCVEWSIPTSADRFLVDTLDMSVIITLSFDNLDMSGIIILSSLEIKNKKFQFEYHHFHLLPFVIHCSFSTLTEGEGSATFCFLPLGIEQPSVSTDSLRFPTGDTSGSCKFGVKNWGPLISSLFFCNYYNHIVCR